MEIPLARIVAGKKFMWDGAVYSSREEAQKVLEGYAQDGFEVHLAAEGDQHLVFTRRVAAVQSEG